MQIAYEWKVDFALVISVVTALITISLWLHERRSKNREKRIRAYEEIYEDVCFLLQFPYRQRKQETEAIQYTNADPTIQEAVRSYLDFHWMDRMWDVRKLVPTSLSDEEAKQFLEIVQEEASEFEDARFRHRVALGIPDRSPVFYVDNPEVSERLSKLLRHVGQNLSLFDYDIRQCWERARFKDPAEVRSEYEKALRVCPHFFEHNPRDFDDPFVDIAERIREEYRNMTLSRSRQMRWTLGSFAWKLARPFRAVRSWWWQVRSHWWQWRTRRRYKRMIRKSADRAKNRRKKAK